jgi:hypothetical protein
VSIFFLAYPDWFAEVLHLAPAAIGEQHCWRHVLQLTIRCVGRSQVDILQYVEDLHRIVVVLNGGRAWLPGIYVYGSHSGKRCPIERVPSDVQAILRFSGFNVPGTGAEAQALFHKPRWKSDPSLFVVNLASVFLEEFQGPFTLKSDTGLFQHVQTASVNRFYLFLSQYLEWFEIAKVSFCWHRLSLHSPSSC